MSDEKGAIKQGVDETVSAAKRNKGMLVGAAVGTVVFPGVGTIIGGAFGSLWD